MSELSGALIGVGSVTLGDWTASLVSVLASSGCFKAAVVVIGEVVSVLFSLGFAWSVLTGGTKWLLIDGKLLPTDGATGMCSGPGAGLSFADASLIDWQIAQIQLDRGLTPPTSLFGLFASAPRHVT